MSNTKAKLEGSKIWLGLAGAYVQQQQPGAVDHYTTKVGGMPCFPGLPPADLRSASSAVAVVCQACGHFMPLVFQAYAPLEVAAHGVHAPERTIYVHGCVRPGCGRSHGAWRAFSSQVQHEAPQQQDKASCTAPNPRISQQQPQHQQQQNGAQGADWGFDDGFGSFGDGPEGNDAGGALDFGDLNTALDDVASSQMQAKSEQQTPAKGHKLSSRKQAAAERNALPSWIAARTEHQPVLPEFYVVAEPEGQGGNASIKEAEQAHIKSLLLDYQQEGATDLLSPSGAAGNGMGGISGCTDHSRGATMEVEEEGGSEGSAGWVGEEYEEDSVRGVQPSYLKFSKRLLQRPEQCVRYCRGSQPLWPLSQLPEAGQCTRCGAPRVFELQLMAPLISMLVEAGEALSEHDQRTDRQLSEHGLLCNTVDAQAVNGAANWDLCTVAIFTCSRACSAASNSGGSCNYNEEHIVIVNEDACHTSQMDGI
ncbi:programmed cell death protein 2 [Dunaliella salina]|uniref:Programmed cell death protein 2 n=1 Tax=Dunaliella salina TaxID=3046 RepID=A0ABQ7GCG1_DUNSA|nr:programmed cell death protein 2 [Dunaliella salina]|eukprot:KAF5832243.1 programmed cell death protein 2 [Dunaliella salina]